MADKRKLFNTTVKSSSTSSSSYHQSTSSSTSYTYSANRAGSSTIHKSNTSPAIGYQGSSTIYKNNASPTIGYQGTSTIYKGNASPTIGYQAVYPRTQQLSSKLFDRNSAPYKSLPGTFPKDALLAAGDVLLNSQRRSSASTVHPTLNHERTSTFGNPATSSYSDARPYGSTSTTTTKPASYSASAVPRPITSATSTAVNPSERYSLAPGKAYVYIFNFLKFKDAKISVREGSEQDVRLLRTFFDKYRVKEFKLYEDLSLAKVKKKMSEVSKKRFVDCSCVIFVIMSHGDTMDRIQAYDQMFNLEKEVVERVLMNETLKGKPKLFFVQACKGPGYMEADAHPSATNKNDIYKCFGTYEGTLSFRDKNKGTYFIQNLFPLIESNEGKDIAEVMTLLRNKFTSLRFQQAPMDTSTLNKKFFFKDLK